MKAKLFFQFYIISILLFSCNNNKTKRKSSNSSINNLKIGDSLMFKNEQNNYLFYNIKQFDFLVWNNEKNSISIGKNGLFESWNYEKQNGEFVEYFFINGELDEKRVTFRDNDNIQSDSELYRYKDGLVDIQNSSFIEINVINETKSEVEIQIDYKGGYSFQKGEIYLNLKKCKVFEVQNPSIIKMEGPSKKIKLLKKNIKNDSYFLTVVIQRGLDKEIRDVQTNSLKGSKFFRHIYIKEIKL